ncbi:YbhB/YbcL family Raf kinase inhibitor-like protein [Candidatus Dependentiae bacterium]|nr:YbhB/YbcL family Raf kinase inhibitor-like protein [Candidatus Dependentiae bacterium]
MILKSNSFGANQEIPEKYTCSGANISPHLVWENAPKHTKSFALIVDDPDAPKKTWVHWVVYNIPATLKEIIEGHEIEKFGAKPGMNDFGTIKYGGPCPPKGNGFHRYFFKLYALDTDLKMAADPTKEQVLEAMKGHVLAQAELIGRFKRD